MKNQKRTILYILDEHGNEILTEEYFSRHKDEGFYFNEREKIQIAGKENPIYRCAMCHNPVYLRGGKNNDSKSFKTLHFAHFNDNKECDIKTSHMTKYELLFKRYANVKESDKHKQTIQQISNLLRNTAGVSNVVREKRTYNKNKDRYKYPDLKFQYKGIDVVFEVQVSQIFLDVVVDRQEFYKENNMFIMWIFDEFNPETHKQRFYEKDILYSNMRNVFVFDADAKAESTLRNELVLKCYYVEPILIDGNVDIHGNEPTFLFEYTYKTKVISYRWSSIYVKIDDIIFNNNKAYYFDFNNELITLNNKMRLIRNQYFEKTKTKLNQEFLNFKDSLTPCLEYENYTLYKCKPFFFKNIQSAEIRYYDDGFNSFFDKEHPQDQEEGLTIKASCYFDGCFDIEYIYYPPKQALLASYLILKFENGIHNAIERKIIIEKMKSIKLTYKKE